MATAKATLPAECVRLDERTVAALCGHADFAQTMRRFAEALQDQVFCQPAAGDRMDVRLHQKVLLRADTYLVLQTIWKESAFITEEELHAAGLARKFRPGTLTCHKLGVELAASKEDVGASNTRVKTIVTAAEAYDLIKRATVRVRHRPLLGTALLHSIMVDIIQPLTPHPVVPLLANQAAIRDGQ